MKKIFITLILLSFCFQNAYGVDIWDKSQPAGSDSPSTLDDDIGTNNEALDRVLSNYRENCAVYYISASSIGIKAGECVGSNTAGTVRKFRKTTSATTLTWANIDTGAEENSTTYHIYAVMDSADATTFTGMISKNATTPTGATYYKKIGKFYNNSSGNISNNDTLINYNNYYALKLGDWESKSNNTVYQASTDGFVVGYGAPGYNWGIYSDSATPPTTLRQYYQVDAAAHNYGCGMCPIRKGDYWKTVGFTTAVFWISMEREV